MHEPPDLRAALIAGFQTEQTLAEIGRRCGVSRQRASQVARAHGLDFRAQRLRLRAGPKLAFEAARAERRRARAEARAAFLADLERGMSVAQAARRCGLNYDTAHSIKRRRLGTGDAPASASP